jgi:hypothetical protein
LIGWRDNVRTGSRQVSWPDARKPYPAVRYRWAPFRGELRSTHASVGFHLCVFLHNGQRSGIVMSSGNDSSITVSVVNPVGTGRRWSGHLIMIRGMRWLSNLRRCASGDALLCPLSRWRGSLALYRQLPAILRTATSASAIVRPAIRIRGRAA